MSRVLSVANKPLKWNVVMPNVVMLSVVAPPNQHANNRLHTNKDFTFNDFT